MTEIVEKVGRPRTLEFVGIGLVASNRHIHNMTRFKILKRLEAAIQSADQNELRWALSYCESRLKNATMKQHERHWRKLVERTQAALDRAGDGGRQ